MSKTWRGATGLVLAGVLLAGGCADGGEADPGHGELDRGAEDLGHGDGHQEAPAAASYNDADVAYAVGMIIHHEQAIEVSDLLLATPGVETIVADLAQDIKDAQGPEIEQMNAWLEEWDQSSVGHGEHADPDHGGMLDESDLAALAAAEGPEASRLFLEQMIEHHEGAIAMAQEHLHDGAHADALALSEQVIADQAAEIEQMDQMLDAL